MGQNIRVKHLPCAPMFILMNVDFLKDFHFRCIYGEKQKSDFLVNLLIPDSHWTVCPLSKGNQAPHLKFERLKQKSQNPIFVLPRSRIGSSSSLESSMKRFPEDLTQIKTNENQ